MANSTQTRTVLRLLGRQIAIARREAGRSGADVAERAGITRKTLTRIEHGDPRVAIGTVFEVATLLGVPLFAEDRRRLPELSSQLDTQLRLLPQRVRSAAREVDDDF